MPLSMTRAMLVVVPAGVPGVTYVLDPREDSMSVELRHLGKVLHVWTFRTPRRLTRALAEELIREIPGLDEVAEFIIKPIGR